MRKKTEKIFVIVAAALVLVALYFIPLSHGYLGLFFEFFTEPNWGEVSPRNVVKSAIPINLIEKIDEKCKVTANLFDEIVDHRYFKRGDELARDLDYDRENETIILSCDVLKGEKSKLNVWYVLEESPRHALKYQYFVTASNETASD